MSAPPAAGYDNTFNNPVYRKIRRRPDPAAEIIRRGANTMTEEEWYALDPFDRARVFGHGTDGERMRHIPREADPFGFSEPATEAERRACDALAAKQLLRFLPDERARTVLDLRFGLSGDGEEWTLAQVGGLLGISASRVEQLERRALQELRRRVRRRPRD